MTNETRTTINSNQFENIQTAVASYFADHGIQVFIFNMEKYVGDDAEELVFVDVAVAGHPEINGTVEVDTNLNVMER